jgi:hypothetical protein
MWTKAGKWKEWSSWGGEDNVFRNQMVKNGYEICRGKFKNFLHIDHPRDYSVYKNSKICTDFKAFVKAKKTSKNVRRVTSAKPPAKSKNVKKIGKKINKRVKKDKKRKLKRISRRRK